MFLKEIKSVDQDARVLRPLINWNEAFRPGATSPTAMLEFLDENLAASLTRRPRKHIVDDRPEVSVEEPRILKPEASTTRDFGASSEEKRNMVRAEACQRGEGGVREDCIPI